MNVKEIVLVSAIIGLILLNAYSWFRPDGSGEPKQPEFTGPTTLTQPTTTVKCPENLQAIDPSKLKHKFGKKAVNGKEANIVEKIIYKDKIVEKYPDWFDPKKTAILADLEIPAWKAKTYVVSTLDLTTGKGGITYKHLPQPFLGFENEARISAGYIFLGDDAGKFMLTGQYTPFRMGNWYIGAFGQAIGSRMNAGANVEYRW